MSPSKLIFALSLLVPAAAIAPDHTKLADYSFEQYVSHFNKKYSPEEMDERRNIYLHRRAAIIEHNKAGRTWTENVNEFTDMTPKEHQARKGINKGLLFKQRSMKTGAKPKKVNSIDLPHSVDWRLQNVVTPVKNQEQCGSCWAFAATECLESHIALQTGLLFTLSEQEFASCVDNVEECGGTGGCEGATMELAYQYAADNGLVTEWTTPYLSATGNDFDCMVTDSTARVATITGYENVAMNDYDGLMEAVATVGPVGITVDASAWSSYSGGVFDGCNQENPDLDHGVLLVGYGTDSTLGVDYWLVRNSWGPAYGEQGYIRLLRTADEGDRCGYDITPGDGVACKGDNSTETVCGTCGILYDAAYPVGGALP